VVWELVFMMVILKIPILYLCAVVWWAIRAEPRPPEGAPRLVEALEPPPAPPVERSGAIEAIAGLLAAAAIFVSLMGLAYRPARLVPVAILLALVSSAI